MGGIYFQRPETDSLISSSALKSKSLGLPYAFTALIKAPANPMESGYCEDF